MEEVIKYLNLMSVEEVEAEFDYYHSLIGGATKGKIKIPSPILMKSAYKMLAVLGTLYRYRINKSPKYIEELIPATNRPRRVLEAFLEDSSTYPASKEKIDPEPPGEPTEHTPRMALSGRHIITTGTAKPLGRLTYKEREHIQSMHKQGMSLGDIMEKTGRSFNVVHKYSIG